MKRTEREEVIAEIKAKYAAKRKKLELSNQGCIDDTKLTNLQSGNNAYVSFHEHVGGNGAMDRR